MSSEQNSNVMDENLNQLIEQLYNLLRDQGYREQSETIKKLLYYFELNDTKNFRKELKSPMIWGGAGSIRDIDLRDKKKQITLDIYLKKLEELGSKM